MSNMAWSQSGLLHNIHNQLRWRTDQGMIYVVTANNQIVAVSCVEYPEHATNWAIGGIRTWIVAHHRTTHLPSYILDQQIVWARARSCDFLTLTFNEYNRAAHRAVQKGYSGKAGWSTWWQDCLAVPAPIKIRNVNQWCVIKPVACSNNKQNLDTLIEWENSQNK